MSGLCVLVSPCWVSWERLDPLIANEAMSSEVRSKNSDKSAVIMDFHGPETEQSRD